LNWKSATAKDDYIVLGNPFLAHAPGLAARGSYKGPVSATAIQEKVLAAREALEQRVLAGDGRILDGDAIVLRTPNTDRVGRPWHCGKCFTHCARSSELK